MGAKHFESGFKIGCPSPLLGLPKRLGREPPLATIRAMVSLTKRIASATVLQIRAAVAKEAGQDRTRVVNKVRHILRRHNLHWEMPTKKFPSKSGLAWLKQCAEPGGENRSLLIKPLFHRYQSRLGWRQKVSLDGTPRFTCGAGLLKLHS